MNPKMTLIAVAVAAVAGGAWWATSTPKTGPAMPIAAANAQEAGEVDTSGVVEMTLGPADAKVTVVEYASFTCPHCATFHKGVLKQMKADYVETGKVQFIYRDVYFDRFGLWASMIARCDTDRFFGVTDLLYDQQKEWIGGGDPVTIANNLRRIGKVAGLEEETLEACLADTDKAKALLAWYQENAEADDVTATPSLVIDGEKYSNMSYDELKVVLDKKLAE